MLLLRSLMFVPGNREDMLTRAASVPADAIVIDLEDAVPAPEKDRARKVAAAAIRALAGAGRAVHVRVNALHTGLTRDDLAAVVGPGLAAVHLPKVETAQDVRDLDVLLRERELASGLRPGTVRSVALIETARGVLRCEDICRASDRLAALALGAEDLSRDLGVPRPAGGETEGLDALFFARATLAYVARAYRLAAVDTPYPNVRDEAGLVREATLARRLGMKGKYAIHPAQVETLNRAFSPTSEQIAEARRVIAAYEEAAARGVGTVSVDGRMVDEPIVRAARELLALAERTGTGDDG
ncbi:MAG TPA: CoA ester lyase [Dehalococcoidia bacterium]|nr:CoA ester lyase [Dehalococcoidia bacterium]